MTESENENDHFDLDHFDHFRMRQVAMEREKSNKKFACLLT